MVLCVVGYSVGCESLMYVAMVWLFDWFWVEFLVYFLRKNVLLSFILKKTNFFSYFLKVSDFCRVV